jgi:hypothetical protein
MPPDDESSPGAQQPEDEAGDDAAWGRMAIEAFFSGRIPNLTPSTTLSTVTHPRR